MATATRKPKRRAKPKRPTRAAKPARQPADASLTKSPIGDKLTDEMKLFVVQQLARYDTPQVVALAVRDRFDVEVTRQSIHYYDPTHDPKPPEKWCAIFEAERKRFLDNPAETPASLRSVRLHRLERMALAAEKQRNFALASAILEQIAKETGELFTNRHKMELTGKDGEPIEVKTDDLRDRIARRISGVASRIGPATNNSGTLPSGVRSA